MILLCLILGLALASCAPRNDIQGRLAFLSDGSLSILDLKTKRERTLWTAAPGEGVRGLAAGDSGALVFTTMGFDHVARLVKCDPTSGRCWAWRDGAAFATNRTSGLAMHYAVVGPDSGWLVAESPSTGGSTRQWRICRTPSGLSRSWPANVNKPVDLGAGGMAYQAEDHTLWVLESPGSAARQLSDSRVVPLIAMDHGRVLLVRQEETGDLLEISAKSGAVRREWNFENPIGWTYNQDTDEILSSEITGPFNLAETASLWATDRSTGRRRQLAKRAYMRDGVILPK